MKSQNSPADPIGFRLTGSKPTTYTLWFPVTDLKAKRFNPSEGNKAYWFFSSSSVRLSSEWRVKWMRADSKQTLIASHSFREPLLPSRPPRHMPDSELHIRQQQSSRLEKIEHRRKTCLRPLGRAVCFFLPFSAACQRRTRRNPFYKCVSKHFGFQKIIFSIKWLRALCQKQADVALLQLQAQGPSVSDLSTSDECR